MARTVADAALFMRVLSRPDPRDWSSLPPQDIDWSALDGEARGAAVGCTWTPAAGSRATPRSRRGEPAAAVFEAAGAVVEPVEPFMSQDLLDDLDLFWRVRSWNDFRELAPEAACASTPHRPVVSGRRGRAGHEGASVLQQIMRIQARTVAATAPYDLVLSPVAPVAAFPAERPMPFAGDAKTMHHIGFTAPYNMSGRPRRPSTAALRRTAGPSGYRSRAAVSTISVS